MRKGFQALPVSGQMAPVTITGTESIPHYVVILVTIVTAATGPEWSPSGEDLTPVRRMYHTLFVPDAPCVGGSPPGNR